MTRRALRVWGIVCLVAATCFCAVAIAHAASLDENDDIKLGVRAYTAARVGSEQTDSHISNVDRSGQVTNRQTLTSLTFPVSPAGHLRQNRFFVEAELDHDLRRLMRDGFGPLGLLNDLPFKIRKLKYHLTYRGEYEGIYDYGPKEYRTAVQFRDTNLAPCFSGLCPSDFPGPGGGPSVVSSTRDRLRHVAVLRNRLFQAYLETQMGDLLIRFGRQILAWGETDNFRLLDNINPVDNSFGGFLIPLDERRIPLDMLVANYYFGNVGPLNEAYVEGFLAIDNHVAFKPGIPIGSAWALPNFQPSTTQFDSRQGPARTFHDARGGVQLKFNAPVPGIGDATFGLAYYRTYLDTPRAQVLVNQNFPLGITSGPATGYLAWVEQTAPPVEIMGGTTTFAIPSELSRHLFLSGEPIIRSELAYFRGEPRFSQAALDPFIFGTGGCGGLPIATGKSQCSISGASCKADADCGASGGQCVEVMARQGELVRRGGNTYCTGKRSTGDSWNFVLGIDINQWFRFLNPRQTFFISTQFFYKHLNGAVKRTPVLLRPGCDPQTDPTCLVAYNQEVLPVPQFRQEFPGLTGGATEPILVQNPTDQFLQTLLIATSYYSGQINPSLTLFYDWSGAFVAIPQITYSRDPFRFTVSYSYLEASSLKGASGVSLLRDRDNFLFQFEYVI